MSLPAVHPRFVQAAVKKVCTNCACSGACGAPLQANHKSESLLHPHPCKQRCAAGGLLRDGGQRERQTEAPLDGTLQGGIAPQTVAGAKQPPGGQASGIKRSAVVGGKLIRHAAQQSMEQGNGGKILLIQSAEHGTLRRVLPRSGKRRAELRHIVRHGSLQRAEHGGVGGRAGRSRDQLGCLAEKTLQ